MAQFWSSLETVVRWTASTLGVPCATYPPAGAPGEFATVQRVGGECDYPHDSPRFAVTVFTGSEGESEQAALALATVLRTLADADARINAVGPPSLVSVGYGADGRFAWQLVFQLETNIRID
ncbi:Uncharacterised protein [Slackia heliotrinireducens]|uniref:DUF3168 domain-containing protein n=1 Tax=Slackia heliotrinireducens (strain ATCC 29202 / DSM 20476 / NCTC 11029 / RHS 1) TaxID=471855 RepID=C7N6N5_SLAHD|nr:hypothetical protein [Slackia heliotrinireducens]ACV22570.1 hypothetical protein Shel_15510 [Slackia heliotrinireducens DSM 20476]VEH01051.1 Uncharacterised protein [Slackia heliotrinireducens]